MDKTTNKLKSIFCAVLIFVLSANIATAIEAQNIKEAPQQRQVPTNVRDTVLNLFKIIDVLFIAFLLFFILSMLGYFFCVIKKEDQKKNRIKKMLIKFFMLFSIFLIFKIIIFAMSYVPL